MLLWWWRRRRLPSAAGTAEPRPGGRGGGGGGGSRCGRACVPPSGPPQRRARPAASPGPGRAAPGCRSPDLPRFTAPARHGGGEAAAGRAGGPGSPEGPCRGRPVALGFPGSAESAGVQRASFSAPESEPAGLTALLLHADLQNVVIYLLVTGIWGLKITRLHLFLGCPLQIPKTFNVYLLQSDSIIHNYLKVIVTVCLL